MCTLSSFGCNTGGLLFSNFSRLFELLWVFGLGCFHHSSLIFQNSSLTFRETHIKLSCLVQFSLSISLTHNSKNWVRVVKMETTFSCFQVMKIINGILVNKTKILGHSPWLVSIIRVGHNLSLSLSLSLSGMEFRFKVQLWGLDFWDMVVGMGMGFRFVAWLWWFGYEMQECGPCRCGIQICGVAMVGLDLRCASRFSLFLYGFMFVCLRCFLFVGFDLGICGYLWVYVCILHLCSYIYVDLVVGLG